MVYESKGNGYVLLHSLFLLPWICCTTEVYLGCVLLPIHLVTVLPCLVPLNHSHDRGLLRSCVAHASLLFSDLLRCMSITSSLVFMHVHSRPPYCDSSLLRSPTTLVHHLPLVSPHVHGLLWTCMSFLFFTIFSILATVSCCERSSLSLVFVCVHARLSPLGSLRNAPSAGVRSLPLPPLCTPMVYCGRVCSLHSSFLSTSSRRTSCTCLHVHPCTSTSLLTSRRSPTASVPLVPLHGRLYASPSHDDSSRRFLQARVTHPLAFFCARPWFTVVVSAFLSGLVFPPNIS